MCKLRHNNANHSLWHYSAVSKRLAYGIGIEIVLSCILLDSPAALFAYAG